MAHGRKEADPALGRLLEAAVRLHELVGALGHHALQVEAVGLERPVGCVLGLRDFPLREGAHDRGSDT